MIDKTIFFDQYYNLCISENDNIPYLMLKQRMKKTQIIL